MKNCEKKKFVKKKITFERNFPKGQRMYNDRFKRIFAYGIPTQVIAKINAANKYISAIHHPKKIAQTMFDTLILAGSIIQKKKKKQLKKKKNF